MVIARIYRFYHSTVATIQLTAAICSIVLFVSAFPPAAVSESKQPESEIKLTPIVDQPAGESAIRPGTENPDDNKSVDALLEDAQQLFLLRQPIDARAKLQRALQVAPQDYRPHMLLGAYYLSEVGHFELADRYLRTAEMLFTKEYGSDIDGSLQSSAYRQHSRLLYLLSEARLNLDDYAGSLAVLDRFAKQYWDDWYPGTRAWVLMKLKRVDDAIRVAQAGILQGAEPTRTYNILGILLSLKDSRELAIQAFARSIRAELALGGGGQVATPLNNAGEVYNEMFRDRMAEAAWLQATQMPDGCDHILPSLNLAIMYTSELRLFQARRSLKDFEACFASHSVRTDTEHRALLALQRGRIALHEGDSEEAVQALTAAAERQQWFGKIGTDPDDLKFAALSSLGLALESHAAYIRDRAFPNLGERIRDRVERAWLQTRAWWSRRRAREVAIDRLEDLEDLHIRNTDAMIEYATLGWTLADLSESSLARRLDRLEQTDKREVALAYYSLYRATNLLTHNEYTAVDRELKEARKRLRPIDRLASAQALIVSLRSLIARDGLLSSLSEQEELEKIKLTEELFALLPAAVRWSDLTLPLSEITATKESENAETIKDELLRVRFSEVESRLKSYANFRIVLEAPTTEALTVVLWDQRLNQQIVNVSGRATSADDRRELVNSFIAKVFRHRIDPPTEPLPKLEILEGIVKQ